MNEHPKINLVPRWVDVALYAGDGATIRVTVNGGDISSGEVKAQIRGKRDDADVAEEFDVDHVTEPGAALLRLTGEQTANLVNGHPSGFMGAWDMQWTGVGLEPITLIQGKVTVINDVTR